MSLTIDSTEATAQQGHDEFAEYYNSPLYELDCDVHWGLRARLSVVDIALLGIVWLTVFAATAVSMGHWGVALFGVFSFIAIIRRPENGLIILMTTFFAPVFGISHWPLVKILFSVVVFRLLLDNRMTRMIKHVMQRPTYVALAMTVLAVASIAISPAGELARGYAIDYVKSLLLLVFIFALADRLDSSVILLKAMTVLAAVALIIGVTHKTYRNDMALTRLQILRAEAGYKADVLELKWDVDSSRLLAMGVEPNYFGAALIFPFGVAIGLVGARRSMRSRALWALAAVAIMIGIMGTLSRSSFLCMAIVMMVFLLRMRGRSLLPIVLVLVVGALLLSSWTMLGDRVAGISENLGREGGSGRFGLWAASVKFWMSSPFWGHGMGSVFYRIGHASHNTYLTLLAELGLIGVVFYTWILVIAVASLMRAAKVAKAMQNTGMRWLMEGCLAGLIGMMANIGTVTISNAQFVWLTAALCIGLGMQYTSRVQACYDDLDAAAVAAG